MTLCRCIGHRCAGFIRQVEKSTRIGKTDQDGKGDEKKTMIVRA